MVMLEYLLVCLQFIHINCCKESRRCCCGVEKGCCIPKPTLKNPVQQNKGHINAPVQGWRGGAGGISLMSESKI